VGAASPAGADLVLQFISSLTSQLLQLM